MTGDNMENSDIKEVKKDMTRIDIICDELLELETSKRVKKIKDGLLKIKEIVKNAEEKIELC
jgi:hypothetical protein